MRIVIDLQAAQGTNRQRGIGRYAMEFAVALARGRGTHEILIALNGRLGDSIMEIRAAFRGVLPREAFRIWTAPGPLAAINAANGLRARDAALIREAFFASLKPDVVVVTSLFEGLVDDVATSIGTFATLPTAVILYDLIPLHDADGLLTNPLARGWYMDKIAQLQQADLLLAISDASARDCVTSLNVPASRIETIFAAVSDPFTPIPLAPDQRAALMARYALHRDYLMCTGGSEPRKNAKGLIAAFARLPAEVRRQHQLAMVYKIEDGDRAALARFAAGQGLGPDEVVFTGYVPNDDLIALYNGCKAFVFPSLVEGFGLPALEAMQCGRAVIASNTSSLPEVVGRADALFDPTDLAAMAAMIERVLTDTAWRTELEAHGLRQARTFSWESTARRTLQALERAFAAPIPSARTAPDHSRKPRLAFVSPLPPLPSGIADYSADLLPALAEHYEIDLILDQAELTDPWAAGHLPKRTVDWFRAHAHHFDRVLYHFGNSKFHQHMFDLLADIPGMVVLHDFFLSGIQTHMGAENWARALLESHGAQALAAVADGGDGAGGAWTYPANLAVLQNATGVIVHSEWSRTLADRWYGPGTARAWSVIPLTRHPGDLDPRKRQASRDHLGLQDDELLICSFGDVGETKLSMELMTAFAHAQEQLAGPVRLAFVGRVDTPSGDALQQRRIDAGLQDRVMITGRADEETYAHFLRAADIAVQLRTKSRGETSAAALDALAWGLPLIVNAHGAMAEIDAAAAWVISDRFETEELAEALMRLCSDTALRAELSAQAHATIETLHNPVRCAALYRDAIEACDAPPANFARTLAPRLAQHASPPAKLATLAPALALTFPPAPRRPTLFVDVTQIATSDIRTGIQRVVRAIIVNLLAHPPADHVVTPVVHTGQGNYCVALRFLESIGAIAPAPLPEDLIDPCPGDLFLGLDLVAIIEPPHAERLRAMQRQGVRVVHVLYDLLPIRLPQHFPPDSAWFRTWLRTVATFDGIVCISKAVADDLAAWIWEAELERPEPLDISWFHLGADVMSSAPTRGLPDTASADLASLRARSSFLMVGTIEPRKGHRQVLAAFELLWQQGVDVNLVIVGQQGWQMDQFVRHLRQHPERGHRLFWLEGISDEYLEQIYAASTCLIAASLGEGFGLPLIEAGQHGLALLARDLAVFREIAGAHARYFSGSEPQDVADAVVAWLAARARGERLGPNGLPWLSWRESSAQLLRALDLRPPAGD